MRELILTDRPIGASPLCWPRWWEAALPRDIIVDDSAGDALDAVIAGIAAARAVTAGRTPPAGDWSEDYAMEAFVYY